MDEICKQVDKLFGDKKLTKLLATTRKHYQIETQINDIDEHLEHVYSFVKDSSGEMFFHIDIGVDFTEPVKHAYHINASTKDNTSKLIDTVEFTEEEKKQVNDFCVNLFIRHMKDLIEKRKKLVKELEDNDE